MTFSDLEDRDAMGPSFLADLCTMFVAFDKTDKTYKFGILTVVGTDMFIVLISRGGPLRSIFLEPIGMQRQVMVHSDCG